MLEELLSIQLVGVKLKTEVQGRFSIVKSKRSPNPDFKLLNRVQKLITSFCCTRGFSISFPIQSYTIAAYIHLTCPVLMIFDDLNDFIALLRTETIAFVQSECIKPYDNVATHLQTAPLINFSLQLPRTCGRTRSSCLVALPH